MKQHSFEKFINKEKGSKKKEAIRLEKRKWKEERNKKYEARNTKYDEKKIKSEIRNLNKQDNNSIVETQKPKTGNQKHATEMPLNKFIAHAGICSRREAAQLVKDGKIKVNGDFIYEPGFKVSSADKIVFNNKQVHLQKNLVYILLNKPKDYITT